MTAARLPEAELHSVSSIVQLSDYFEGETSNAHPVKKKLKLGGETLAGGADKDRMSEELMVENTTLKLRILGNPQIGESSSSNTVCPSGVQVDCAQNRTLKTRTLGVQRLRTEAASLMLFLRLSCRQPKSYSDFQDIIRSFRLLGETTMVGEEEEVVGAAGQRCGLSL